MKTCISTTTPTERLVIRELQGNYAVTYDDLEASTGARRDTLRAIIKKIGIDGQYRLQRDIVGNVAYFAIDNSSSQADDAYLSDDELADIVDNPIFTLPGAKELEPSTLAAMAVVFENLVIRVFSSILCRWVPITEVAEQEGLTEAAILQALEHLASANMVEIPTWVTRKVSMADHVRLHRDYDAPERVEGIRCSRVEPDKGDLFAGLVDGSPLRLVGPLVRFTEPAE